MVLNWKSLFYFLAVICIGILPSIMPKLIEARHVFNEQSEQAKEIYTGKLGIVSNPLDEAYKVTDRLRRMVESEDLQSYPNYKVWPIISIWVDPDDLWSEDRGIFFNYEKKGRMWERASFVTYYEKGLKLFSSFAGLRLHGGVSRGKDNPEKSMRLHFRGSFGENEFLPGKDLSLAPNAPIKRLVLHKDQLHHFVADLSFSIVRQLGGIAPKVKPVVVYLNGKHWGFQYMTEHLDEEQLKYYFGHEDFMAYKLKSENDPVANLLYENLKTWINYLPEPVKLSEIEQKIDIDNFTANVLAIMYTGATDWVQGTIVKDIIKSDSKWQWIAWDMDRAFWPWKETSPARENNSQIYGVELFIDQNARALRARIFRRLIKESPEYREYFTQKVTEMMKFKLNSEFFRTKFAEYQKLIDDLEDNNAADFKSLELMKEFVVNRSSELCKQFEARLQILCAQH